MKTIHELLQREGKWFGARCPDLPVTTQGRTLVEGRKNLQEAVELHRETWRGKASLRPPKEVYLASLETAA
ncbi:MAG: type II toxin-antitoxin system HicB family antitoxin [Verrucomicrobiales bacterium]|nr:type II toxin-antitoxin system HicB family antitoxin [Verrucomicrobiales bacterium]